MTRTWRGLSGGWARRGRVSLPASEAPGDEVLVEYARRGGLPLPPVQPPTPPRAYRIDPPAELETYRADPESGPTVPDYGPAPDEELPDPTGMPSAG